MSGKPHGSATGRGATGARAARNTTSRGPAYHHVAITGAAGAIGSALARAMRRAWPTCELALIDREREPLERLASELGGTNASEARANASEPACANASEARANASKLAGANASKLAGANASKLAGASASKLAGPNGSVGSEVGNATVHVADLRDLDALPALVAAIEQAGPLDGLVNCAGVMKVQHVSTWNWAEARDLLTIDLLAPLRLQDLVVRGMRDRGHGVIVNIASMAGRVPLRGAAYYGASKAGLAMASEIARADLAPHGVRVVTVYPGPVKSALEAGARADYGGGGLFGRFAPTGNPDELARRIMVAIAADQPRVIYPRLYQAGWAATNLASWFALSYGPPPVA